MKSKILFLLTASILAMPFFGPGTFAIEVNTNTIEPDEYYVTVRKIMLCKTKPSTPTTTTAMDLSDAVTILDEPAGVSVLVKNGVTAPLGGAATRPTNGTYTYAYVELAPAIKIKAYKGYTSKYHDGTVTGGEYQYFWTDGSESFAWSASRPTLYHSNNEADAVSSNRKVSTVKLNTFQGGYPSDPFGSTPTNSPSITVDNLSAYLMTAANKLGTGTQGSYGDITKLGAVLDIEDVTVSEATIGMDISFEASKGCTLSTIDEGTKIFDHFSAGALNMRVSVK